MGNRSATPAEKCEEWQKEDRSFSLDDIDELEELQATAFEKSPQGNHTTNPSPQPQGSEGPSQSEMARKLSKAKKRKAELSDLLATEMRDVRVALQDIAGAIKTTNRRIRSEEEIVEELIRLGFGGDYLMEGTEFLVADPIRANTFFAFPEEVRRDWLLRKLAC
ncbi:unnamed protein product [Linum trigynum]|uniref:Uncharacterized protein n=1 Tax=Linum trigynum TaxID=586398 RepID=A0AAV2FKP6_9ROSI